MLRPLIIIVVIFFSYSASASDAMGVKITRIHGWKSSAPKGSVYIDIGYFRDDNACAHFGQQGGREFVLNMNDPHAEIFYSHILAAFSADIKIDVIGSGQCGSGAETINELRLAK